MPVALFPAYKAFIYAVLESFFAKYIIAYMYIYIYVGVNGNSEQCELWTLHPNASEATH